MNVLFVCTGNMCRSPMAEAYLKILLQKGGRSDVEVTSAGTHALPGAPPPPEAVATAAQISLDLEHHRARPLTSEMVEQADVILVMAPEHAEHLAAHFPEAARKVELLSRYALIPNDDAIPDPLGGSAFHYRSAYALIAEVVQAFYDRRVAKSPARQDQPASRLRPPGGRRRVDILVPASSANLGPGFDTLGLALTLYNRVTLEEAEADEVHISGEGAHALPRDGSNIVLQAVETAFHSAGVPRPPLRLTLENAIPLARGLGSSAAARVGGLVAARKWCGLSDDPRAVLKQAEALEGHADNAAPSLLGGLTVVAGRGDALRWARAAISEKTQVSLAVPEFEVATSDARKALPKEIPYADAVFNVQRTALLMAALAAGEGRLLSAAMQDRLHQPHRAHLMGPFRAALAAARKAGAAGAALSGAGPTVLALSIAGQADPAAIAEAMAAVYRERGIGCKALVLGIDTQGTRAAGETRETAS
ncbi:MAG: homoserine kinase [Candidatus Tectomicrobia bacterium]|nr:homoserine kinase [Candidatus Tectomicrobia bacterium]